MHIDIKATSSLGMMGSQMKLQRKHNFRDADQSLVFH